MPEELLDAQNVVRVLASRAINVQCVQSSKSLSDGVTPEECFALARMDPACADTWHQPFGYISVQHDGDDCRCGENHDCSAGNWLEDDTQGDSVWQCSETTVDGFVPPSPPSSLACTKW